MLFALVAAIPSLGIDSVQQWMIAGGYVVLFGLLFLCGLGLPLPEDIPLLSAGVLIANGKMDLFIAAACAWCGIIGGDICLYHLGKRFGMGITKVRFVGRHVTEARIARAEALFTRYGVGVVAVGRLFAGIRGAMVVAAGTIRFNFVKFVIADGLAALVSGGLFIWLGVWLGNSLRDNMDQINRYKTYIFVGIAVAAVATILVMRWRKRRSAVSENPAPHETTVAAPESEPS